MRRNDKVGTKYCLKLDVKKFYDNIDHAILKQKLRRKVKDSRLLCLLDKIIDSMPGEKGIPIGSLLSQNFANFYLTSLDNYLKHDLKVKYLCRYMDDIVVLSSSKEYLHAIFSKLKEHLDSLKLTIKENYQIFPIDIRGIDFVGFRMFHRYTLLRKRIALSLKKKYSELAKYKTLKGLNETDDIKHQK